MQNIRLGAALATSLALLHTAAMAERPLACTDFDAHVNGAWQASAVLPPERARIGSFDELRVGNDRLLTAALAELAADPARQATPGLKRLAAFYRSGMDGSSHRAPRPGEPAARARRRRACHTRRPAAAAG